MQLAFHYQRIDRTVEWGKRMCAVDKTKIFWWGKEGSMNILIIHNDYQQVGGETVAVDNQIKLLQKKGHRVLVYRRHNDEIFSFNPLQKLLFFINTIYNVKVDRELHDILNSHKIDIVHVHNVFPLISPSVYRTVKKKRLPIVQTLHNFRFLCPNALFYVNNDICELCKYGNTIHAITKRCYRRSYLLSALYAITVMLHRKIGTFDLIDRYIAPSEFVSLKILESGLIRNRERITVLGNFLNSLPTKIADSRDDYFLYLGRMSAEKGALTLIKAAIQVPVIKLKMAGDGPERHLIENIIQAANAHHIELLGFVTGSRKEELISRAIAVIVPSECYETFNMSAIESMSFGTPVIHPNTGSLPYVVGTGCGVSFKRGSQSSLRDVLLWASSNKKRMMEMGLSGRKRVESNFTDEVHYQSLFQLYRELVSTT